MIYLLFVLSVTSAVLTYGMRLAYFQHKYPRIARDGWRGDCGSAAIAAIFGLFILPCVLEFLLTGFAQYGLMYRNPHKERV